MAGNFNGRVRFLAGNIFDEVGGADKAILALESAAGEFECDIPLPKLAIYYMGQYVALLDIPRDRTDVAVQISAAEEELNRLLEYPPEIQRAEDSSSSKSTQE